MNSTYGAIASLIALMTKVKIIYSRFVNRKLVKWENQSEALKKICPLKEDVAFTKQV